MRPLYLPLLLLCISSMVGAQTEGTTFQKDRLISRNNPNTFNPDWAPFYHGVASGDPLADRVIIWTRVTPEELNENAIQVEWRIATDPDMDEVVNNGFFTTNAERDYTVKVDVTELSPGTTYYYDFCALGGRSLVGRTKTTPEGDQASHLRFGVVSCSNYQAGFFNGYQRLAERTDLDAVIHLGDYIYEYADGVYGDSSLFEDRALEPATEIVELEDYRMRYSTYRLDTSLARVHQQHPFITIWDDHESANDSYKDGAQNHQPATEGDWETRKQVAKQVYFEWMPIRDNETQQVYRTIQYGNIMDLILLDTRLEGREQQLNDIENPDLQDENRTILGADQKAWLLGQLSSSNAKWKVLGQQVIFSEMNLGWAAIVDNSLLGDFNDIESLFLDIWDGYPAERSQIINYISERAIDNVVILTGDFHSTFAFDVSDNPVDLDFLGSFPLYSESDNYDPSSGAGSVAVEFATPSVTSANFDENIDPIIATTFQNSVNANIPVVGNPNPHMKFVDLIQHGYFILDVTEEKVQADWFHAPINEITTDETFSGGQFSLDTENHLESAEAPAAAKPAEIPAPFTPLNVSCTVSTTEQPKSSKFALLGIYPNPFTNQNTLHYSLAEKARLKISLLDASGKLIRILGDEQMPAGIFSLQVQAEDLPEGTYFYQIQINEEVVTAKVLLAR